MRLFLRVSLKARNPVTLGQVPHGMENTYIRCYDEHYSLHLQETQIPSPEFSKSLGDAPGQLKYPAEDLL